MVDWKRMGQEYQNYRKYLGLTGSDIAEAIGKNGNFTSTVSSFERGNYKGSVKFVRQMFGALGFNEQKIDGLIIQYGFINPENSLFKLAEEQNA